MFSVSQLSFLASLIFQEMLFQQWLFGVPFAELLASFLVI
jgi:hypothetical protein